MSTRCRIAIVQDDGRVKSVYCHHDGYVEGVGKVLQKHYTNPDTINKLVELGDFSSLHETVELTKPEVYDQNDNAYRIDDSYDEFMSKLGKCGEEYTYIFNTDWSGCYVWEYIETPYARNLHEKLVEIGEMEDY